MRERQRDGQRERQRESERDRDRLRESEERQRNKQTDRQTGFGGGEPLKPISKFTVAVLHTNFATYSPPN